MDALGRAGGAEGRVWLLHEIGSDLGPKLYPVLVRILCAVERYGDAGARRLASDTLAYAAETWPLPPGRIEAWGGPASGDRGEGFEVGPVEYLLVWHLQQDVIGPLPRDRYGAAMRFLLRLVCATPRGRRAHAEHLAGVARRGLPGHVGARVCGEAEAIAQDLSRGLAPAQIAERAVARAATRPAP